MICNTYVQFFSTLAEPTRLNIINELRKGPKTVTELAKALKFEQSRISHNLRKLKERGFVEVTPQGKERLYDIDRKTILPLLTLIDKHVDTYYKHYCRCKAKEESRRRALKP